MLLVQFFHRRLRHKFTIIGMNEMPVLVQSSEIRDRTLQVTWVCGEKSSPILDKFEKL